MKHKRNTATKKLTSHHIQILLLDYPFTFIVVWFSPFAQVLRNKHIMFAIRVKIVIKFVQILLFKQIFYVKRAVLKQNKRPFVCVRTVRVQLFFIRSKKHIQRLTLVQVVVHVEVFRGKFMIRDQITVAQFFVLEAPFIAGRIRTGMFQREYVASRFVVLLLGRDQILTRKLVHYFKHASFEIAL